MARSVQGTVSRRGAKLVVLSAVLLALAACSVVGEGGGQQDSGQAPFGTTPTTEPPRVCEPQPLADGTPLAAIGVDAALLAASRQVFPCADRVVIAGSAASARWTAAGEAIDEGAAFLVTGTGTVADPAVVAELQRLAPEEVVLVGIDPAVGAALSGDWESSALPPDPLAEPPVAPGDGDRIWLVNGADPELAATLAPLATVTGAAMVETTAEDLRQLDPVTRARLGAASDVQLVGSFPADAQWQLDVVRSGHELPGGGLTLFPDRRFIAFYGVPGSSALGVLGEQDPAATLERMQPLLAGYETDDGVQVIPSFELIATVASAEAGDDGDYSNEQTVASLRPYVDFAVDNGVYVLLDLQPGRTDFLTQARRYEELLRLPHVGLALDPEWRLGPDQVHLRQFGSVDADEINEVSDWLAGIVREEGLPQKMLLIHQFNLSMVTNRAAVVSRPELSLVIQMDGQGPLGTKYGTLAAVVRGTEGQPWRWGWKNFYDEDTPMATPAQTLRVDPQPVYVSYQ